MAQFFPAIALEKRHQGEDNGNPGQTSADQQREVGCGFCGNFSGGRLAEHVKAHCEHDQRQRDHNCHPEKQFRFLITPFFPQYITDEQQSQKDQRFC